MSKHSKKMELMEKAKWYVEDQAKCKVLKIDFDSDFTLLTFKDSIFSVHTTDSNSPEWWVVGGSTPMNLYSKRMVPSADEAFSFHMGGLPPIW